METTVFTSLELGYRSLYKEAFSPLKTLITFFTTLVLNNIKLGHSFISSITINIAVTAIKGIVDDDSVCLVGETGFLL